MVFEHCAAFFEVFFWPHLHNHWIEGRKKERIERTKKREERTGGTTTSARIQRAATGPRAKGLQRFQIRTILMQKFEFNY